MADQYGGQDRGGAEAYNSYYAGMDKTMRQKVALVCSFFPTTGRVADMGCGSGKGSADIASLYPGLELHGVDINPKSVDYAATHYQLPNLHFRLGDIADPVFGPNELDGILNSSVLHHVTSFNGFEVKHIERLLDNQVAALREGGTLAIRDFVVPDRGAETVALDLPPATFETFRRFAREFRCSLYSGTGFQFREESAAGGWVRAPVSLRLATEFLLRKDYLDDWTTEILEEYCYFSRRDFEAAFARRGLRLVVSKPLHNPWIVRNRFLGQARIADLHGNALEFPATNYLIVGEKVAKGRPVKLVEARATEEAAPSFLRIKAFTNAAGERWELVERPHDTIDVLPWFEENGEVKVLARQSYPRPILSSASRSPDFDESRRSGYVPGPLNFIDEHGDGDVARTMAERWGFAAEDILEASPALSYFPSAGGILERVRAVHVRLRPGTYHHIRLDAATATVEKGKISALDANQTLRSYQVGGLCESRLELNIIDLLLRRGATLTSWIGDTWGALPEIECRVAGVEELLGRSALDYHADPDGTPAFLRVVRSEFQELDSAGRPLSTIALEHVRPKRLSTNTAACLPVARIAGEICVAVEMRSLPAAQEWEGNSLLPCAPAWRLPEGMQGRGACEAWLRARLLGELGARAAEVFELGGSYFPSSGCTGESVSAWVATIDQISAPDRLRWLKLNEAIENRERLRDGHLLAALLRLVVLTRSER